MDRLTLRTGPNQDNHMRDHVNGPNARGGRGGRQRNARGERGGLNGDNELENWVENDRVGLAARGRGAAGQGGRGGGGGGQGRHRGGRGRGQREEGGGEGGEVGVGGAGGGRGGADRGRWGERGVRRGGRGDRGGGGERGRGAERREGAGRGGERVRGEVGVQGRRGNGAEGAGGRGGERRGGGAAGGRGQRDEGRLSSTARGSTPQGRRLGFKTLEELSGKDPSEVAITLSTCPALKALLAESEMRQDLVQLLCLALCKAFQARTERGTLQHLAGVVKDSAFFRTVLPHYVAGMGSEFSPIRRELYPQHLDNILALLSEVLSIYPASSVQAVSMLAALLQASINSLRASGVDVQPQTVEQLEGLQGLVKHLQERSREGTLRSDRDSYVLLPIGGNNPGGDEGQDYRTLPIYPTAAELHQDQRPFLRPNLTSQRYTSTRLYLDTHFRLLREDFVRPLREGIQQLLRSHQGTGQSDSPVKRKRFDDIRVYFDTQLVVPICTQAGVAYVVHFDSQPLQFVRWENSKRLIYGSLVCLSCDNFESFLFATVSDRDPKQLERGLVQLIFTEESRHKLATMQTDQLFLMVETTAYFEAYRYVLEGLQELEEENLPFQRYIVECSLDVHPPAYLARGDTYNLASIAEPEYQSIIKPFDSLQPEAWPRMEELGLDESQMRALQLALTKEMAIIQGPPGTGKTYVGLKIAQALLTNQDLWRNALGNAPMLVVCYTNHALDQFLEGIHKFLPEGIVRVGGRSNSDILKPFFLRELTRSPSFRHSLPGHLRFAYKEIYEDLNKGEREIQEQGVRLECSLRGVLRETFLRRFISEGHWASLHFPPRQGYFETRSEKSCLIEWLGLGSTIVQQRATEDVNINGDMEDAEAMEEEEEDLIEIVEEAELIQRERIIEDDHHHRGGREEEKRRDMEETIREVEEVMLAMNLENVEIQAEQSEEGWQIQRDQRKKMKNKIKRELGRSAAMTETEERVITDVWILSLADRWRLYRLWVSRYRAVLRAKALESEQAYQNAADRLADVRCQENLCVLRAAKVIGMTTTGAAKFRKALQRVRPRLVIVEEAAEVLEAHIITTLSEACQHLILIGDHQQLRPSATVYELAKNFSLEVSMFERLVKMEFPYVRLNYQHRMRPDIARLLTPHIYSELENHPSVMDYDDIKGLNTNLFFVEHNHHEEEIKDGRSHQNRHEAMFVVSLCRYLLFQDYKPEQITILTTYTGQLHCLRKLMPASEFVGVKVHVVDKYQGEENDIVLLSLVRSNTQGKVGFLNIPNRVCVALSRAKKGLYCIGNSVMLSQVKLWSKILHTLREKGQVGKGLTLCCQNHPDRQVEACCADDFKQAPEGGCQQPCEFRLDCGHVCASVCHPYDPEHKKYKCVKKCQKVLCDLGHRCTLVCHRTCPKQCTVRVEKTIPKCQHKQMVPCHQDPETFVCQEPCQKMLLCGHKCDSVCGEQCTSKCQAKVTLKLKCGHSQQDACYYKGLGLEPDCRTPCDQMLKCGHNCTGSCHRCHQGRYHHTCYHKCERLLICSHKCREPCTRDCPSCRMPCENRCVHSKCKRQCGQPCAPCVEPCVWQCPHQSCSKLCHEPCDRPPCTLPCAKTLACGHPCIGLCGDRCPNKCRICDHEEVTEIFFGTEDDPTVCFIQLEDCGHIIESEAMDTYMGMDGNQQDNEGEQVAIKLKECPKCRTPIRKNLRYGSHVNCSLAEIEKVKEKINGRQTDIAEQRQALKNLWIAEEDLQRQLPEEHMKIRDELRAPHLTAKDLWVLENKIAFLQRVEKLLKIGREQMSDGQGLSFEEKVDEFLKWLMDYNQKFAEQQVSDLQSELDRLTFLAELNARCNTADKKGQGLTIQAEVQAIRKVLEKLGPFTGQDLLQVTQDLKDLDDKLPHTGLGISDDERKMIVSAMKLGLGHWFKCPNGHVYAIGDCGGAAESRQCPDCNATIGGGNHRLTADNQLASEMDGAQHAAWPPA